MASLRGGRSAYLPMGRSNLCAFYEQHSCITCKINGVEGEAAVKHQFPLLLLLHLLLLLLLAVQRTDLICRHLAVRLACVPVEILRRELHELQ